MVGSSLMLRCCCVGWHVAGQDFQLGYLFHLNMNNYRNNPNEDFMVETI